MSYDEYIKSDHWKELRSKVVYFGRRCEICQDKFAQHAHHKVYKNYFDVLPKDLIAVCKSCHGVIHRLIKRNRIAANSSAEIIRKFLFNGKQRKGYVRSNDKLDESWRGNNIKKRKGTKSDAEPAKQQNKNNKPGKIPNHILINIGEDLVKRIKTKLKGKYDKIKYLTGDFTEPEELIERRIRQGDINSIKNILRYY